MSNTIDTNIVQLKFDNKQFEQGCKESMDTLEKLRKSIDDTGSGDALTGLGKAANKIDLSHLAESIDAVQKRFSVLGVVGMTAISEITRSAMQLAHKMLTVIPNQIKNGGWNRAMNIEKAKFQLEGLGITWDKVGTQISNAVSGTAYGMDQAARAASQLAASGIKIGEVYKDNIDEMEMSLKAISGVSAQTNSSYDDISRIFTQVAGQGRLMGDQLLQLSQRGMNAAATLAKAFGTTEAEVRGMVSKGQVSFQMFSEAMYDAFAENAFKANNTFDGALSNMKAALSRTGEYFSGPIIRQMIPVWNSLRLAINRVNEQVQIFSSNKVGDRAKAEANYKRLYAELKNLEKGYKDGTIAADEYNKKHKDLEKSVKAAGKAYKDTFGMFERLLINIQKGFTSWVDGLDFSWMEAFGNGIVNIGKGFSGIIRPMTIAFKDAFGKSNLNILQGFSDAFEKLTSHLVLSNKEMAYLKITFQGFFDIAEAIVSIFGDLIGAIFNIDTKTFGLREHLLLITAVIGKMLSSLANLINKMKVAEKIITGVKIAFGVLAGGILMIVNYVKDLTNKFFELTNKGIKPLEALKTVFSKVQSDFTKFAKSIDPDIFKHITEGAEGFRKVLEKLESKLRSNKMFNTVLDKLSTVKTKLGKVKDFVLDVIKKIKEAITGLFGGKETENGIKKTTTEVQNAIYMADQTVQVIHELDLTEKDTAETTKSFGQIIKDFVSNIDLGKLAAIGFTAAIIALGISFANSMDSFSKSTIELSKTLKAFREGGIVGLIFGVKTKPKPNKVKEIAEVILLLAASMTALAFIPSDKLKQAKIAMLEISIGVVALSGAMALFSSKIVEADFSQMMIAMTTFAGSVAIFAGALALIQKLDLNILSKAGITFTVLSGAVLGLSAAFKYVGPVTSAGSLALLALAGSVYILVGALDKLNALNIDPSSKELWGKAGLLAAMTATLVLISGIASRLGTNALLGVLVSLASLKLIIPLARDVIEAVKESGIGSFIAHVVQFFSRFTKEHAKILAGIAVAIVTIAAVAALVIAFKKLKAYVKSIGTTVGEIGKMSGKWDGINKALSRLSMVPVIIALTGMMIAVGALVIVASKIKLDNLESVAVIFGIITTAFIGVGVLAALSEKAKTGPILAAIIGITVIFAEIVALSLLLDKNKTQVYEATAIMGGILAMFAADILAISQIKDLKWKDLAGLSLVVTMLATICGSLIILTQMGNWSSIASAGAAMAACLFFFGNMITKLGKTGMSFTKNKMLAMAEGIGIIVSIGGAIALATLSQDWKSIGISVIPMAGTMFMFTSMMRAIGTMQFDPSGWMAIAGICTTVVAVGGAIALATLSKDWKSIGISAVAMSGTMIVFAGVLEAMTTIPVNPVAIAAMLGCAVSCLAIGGSLAMLAQYPWEQIKAAAIALNATTAIIAAIAGIIGIPVVAGLVLTGAIVLTALGAALIVLGKAMSSSADALANFTNNVLYPVCGIVDKLPSIALGFTELAGALILMGAAGLVLSTGAVGLILGGNGLNKIMTAVNTAQGADIKTVAIGLLELAPGLMAIGVAGIVLGTGAVGLITGGIGMIKIADAVKTLDGTHPSEVASGLSELVWPLTKLSAVGPLLLAGAPGVYTMASAVERLGESTGKAIKTINLAVVNELATVSKKTAQMGYNAMEGYSRGLAKVAYSSGYKNSLVKMANQLPDTFRKELDIHSPSRKMKEIGVFGAQGFSMGLLDPGTWNSLKSKLSSLLSDILAMFKDCGEKISKWFDSVAGEADVLGESLGGADGLKAQLEAMGEEFLAESEATKEASEAMNSFGEAASGAGGKAGKAAEEVDKSAEAYEKLRSNIEGAIKYFEEFDKTVDVSKNDILKNMQSQIDGVTEWTTMLANLQGKGMSGALLEYLGNLGPEGYKYVAAFESMTLEELAQANSLFAQEMMLDEYAATSIMNTYANAGDMVAQGFINGLSENQIAAVSAVQTMGTAGLEAFNAVWGIHSPSRVMADNGKFICIGLRNGLQTNWSLANTTAVTMSKIMMSKIKSELSSAKCSQVGLQMCAGIAAGIRAGQSMAIVAAAQMAAAALEAAKARLAIHSPSRAFAELGMWVDKGFAQGITNYAGEAVDATESLADKALGFMNDVIKTVASGIDGSPELSPVIRPRLDLTQLQNAKSRIGNMVGSDTYNIAANISRTRGDSFTTTSPDSTETVPVTQNFTFNQTNNSPKALDRMEIRRETRNLLGQLKGATT